MAIIRSTSSSGGASNLSKAGRAFEYVERPKFEAALLKDRGVVLGQGLGGGVANYQS